MAEHAAQLQHLRADLASKRQEADNLNQQRAAHAAQLQQAEQALAEARRALTAQSGHAQTNVAQVRGVPAAHVIGGRKLEPKPIYINKASDVEKRTLISQLGVLAMRQGLTNSRHPLIQQLDVEINKLGLMVIEEADANEQKKHFVTALTELRNELNHDIDKQTKKGKSKIDQSTAGRLASNTIEMLKQLQNEKTDKIAALCAYEKKCKATSGWKKFAKVLGAVCIAGVGFVCGALIGLGAGLLFGSFVTGGIGMVAGAVKGTMIGAGVAAAVLGVSLGVGSGVAMFKPKGLTLKALNAVDHGKQAYKAK